MSGRSLLVFAAALASLRCLSAQEINTLTRAELEQLNGIGVTMADRILVERERATFKSWDDLERRVKGMRGARAQRLHEQGATVNGERLSRADKHDEPRQ